MSLVPHEWVCGDAIEPWSLEIEHDRFESVDAAFVVSIHASNLFEGSRETTLVTASPAQAREMAAALLVYAHFAEEANGAE